MGPVVEALVFDLDGTLVDSRADLAAAVDAVRRDLGLAPLPAGAIEGMVGEGARLLVERALDGETRESVIAPALSAFFSHYDRLCLVSTRPYAGVPAALAALAGRVPLALLTNKPERFAVRILEALGLAGHFRQVVGGDTLPQRKPDPAPLRHVAAALGAPLERTLLVGDSRIDAETAARAGAPFAHVRWGYGRDREAEERGALLVIDRPELLADALSPLLAARPAGGGGSG